MQQIADSARRWFARRSEAWLSGDMEHRHLRSGDIPIATMEMARRQEMNRKRGAIDRKVITDARVVLPAALTGSEDRVRVQVCEHLRFLYEIGDTVEHEQRVIWHSFTWDAARASLVAHEQQWEAMDDEARPAAVQSGDYRAGYDRILAFRYAERWWNDRNPAYFNMGVDCTSYVSQVLRAGGFPMIDTGSRNSGWWYRFGAKPNWSYSWSVAHALALLLSDRRNHFRVKIVERPDELLVGDVISYDWNHSGRFTHSTVVTGHDANGYPLVNAHTVDSHRRFYSYEDSYAWTPQTQYMFTHFMD